KSSFVFNEELSGLTGLSVDPVEREVSSSYQLPGGRDEGSSSYKFQAGHFRLTYSDSRYDDNQSVYSLINDSLRETKRIQTAEVGPDTYSYTTYELVDDSLQISNKETKVEKDWISIL